MITRTGICLKQVCEFCSFNLGDCDGREELQEQDEKGEEYEEEFDGLLARAIQHEVDHLKGILFVDRVSSTEDLKKELSKEGYNMKDVQLIG